jgi:prefoldin subunit 5
MEICEICGISVKNKSGLGGHMRFSHPDASPIATEELSKFKQEVKEALTGLKEQVTQLVTEAQSEDTVVDCSECQEQADNFKLVGEVGRLQVITTQKDTEISKLKSDINTVKTAGQKTIEELTMLKSEKNKYPSFRELINHAVGCPKHSAELNDIQAKIVRETLEDLPDSVIEAEGLKRGFIPAKIIIPIRGSGCLTGRKL